MATKRTGHTGGPYPPGGWPGQRAKRQQERYARLVARLDEAAAAMNMTREAFIARFEAPTTPAPRRNGSKPTLDC